MCKWKTNHLPIFLQINVCPLGNIFYLNTSSQGADTEKKNEFHSTIATGKYWYLNVIMKDLLIKVRCFVDLNCGVLLKIQDKMAKTDRWSTWTETRTLLF